MSKESTNRRQIQGIAEIRTFFRTNLQPVYFFGPTAFNLLGIDRWVRNFQYVVYFDSWDGAHPRVFAPKNRPYVEFESSEQINNYLLRDPEVQEYMKRRGGAPILRQTSDMHTRRHSSAASHKQAAGVDAQHTAPIPGRERLGRAFVRRSRSALLRVLPDRPLLGRLGLFHFYLLHPFLLHRRPGQRLLLQPFGPLGCTIEKFPGFLVLPSGFQH